MNFDSLDLNLPTDLPLPPPPPADRKALEAWQNENLADFYRSPYYEAWAQRTWKNKHRGEPFILD